jgi:hypothetical protein
LPFNVKQGFVVAPINRFLKRKEVVKLELDDMDGDEPESSYSVNSHPDLSVAGEQHVPKTVQHGLTSNIWQIRFQTSYPEQTSVVFPPPAPLAASTTSLTSWQLSTKPSYAVTNSSPTVFELFSAIQPKYP